MAISPNSFVWASAGIEPPTHEDAIYTAGDQPIAGFDNHILWAVTSDIHALTDWVGDHGSVHEAGGDQELNLGGLAVGDLLTLDTDGDEFHLTESGSGGSPFARFDLADDRIRAWPAFSVRTTHRGGIDIQGDLDRVDGETLYDYATDRFHRADHATNADHADTADDADTLDGNDASAFLQPADDTTITGTWAFDALLDADIAGHASTASSAATADEADEADEAAWATDAGSADRLADDVTASNPTYYQPTDFLQATEAATITGTWAFAETIDADITGNAATADEAEWTPQAGHAQTAGDADTLDGVEATDLIATAQAGVDTTTAVADDGQEVHADVETLSFDDHLDISTSGGTARIDVGRVSRADYATEAGDSDTVDGYDATELIDEASGVVDAALAVEDDGQQALADAEAISFDEDLSVSVAGDTASVDVGTVSQAQHAITATDADRLDDYHAADLIDEAVSRSSGRWEFIDEWEISAGSGWEWSHDVASVYDRYRLVVLNEVIDAYNRAPLQLRLNNDERSRYSYFVHDQETEYYHKYGSKPKDDWYLTTLEHDWYFPIARAKEGGWAVAEYIVTRPQLVDGSVNGHPKIACDSRATSHDVYGGVLEHGELESNHADVHAFSLEPDGSDTQAAYVGLYGNNITRP